VSISAIIPVWNQRELLARLLDSIGSQTRPFDEVIAIDNGSEDGAAELAESRGARVIRLGRNTGFAHAVNCGIQQCRSARLAILNSDVELHPEWLERLSGTGAAFATGKILSFHQPGILDGTYDLICRGACTWRAGNGKRDNGEFSRPRRIDCASMTAVLFDARLFDEVGLLDESFESYLEDVDFGIRCAALGYHGMYVPEASCRHHGSAALGRWNPDSVRRMARNQIYLVAKHYPVRLIVRWFWPIFAAQTIWGCVAARHGAGFAWLRGKGEGLRQFRRVRRARNPIVVSRVRGLVENHEKSICRLQHELGFDAYWRVYFALTGWWV
jgi:GT2 family glycosyltransferase